MRKLILIIALIVVPLGIWTAGCRNDNRQAAFPKTPEMKALAKSAERASPTTPPNIPAKPIDREILNLPERDTMARVQAVNDRSNQMAGNSGGLFTLPEEQNYMASAYSAPTYSPSDIQAAPNAITPVPSAREFWSKPAKPLRTSRPVNVPEDISAMAAPADDQLIPPSSYMAPSMPGGRQFLPPEDLPGVYSGHDAALPDAPPPASGWIGKRNDKGDALGAPPLSSAGPRPRGRANTRNRDNRSRETASRDGRKSAETTQKGPLKLDLDVLLGPPSQTAAAPAHALAPAPVYGSPMDVLPGAPVVSGVGLSGYEPLPEPMPIEEYRAMKARDQQPASASRHNWYSAESASTYSDQFTLPPMPSMVSASPNPMPADMMIPAPAAMAGKRQAATASAPKKAGTAGVSSRQSGDATSALAPLPDITVPSKRPVDSSAVRANQVSMPAPMPEPLPTPEMAAARNALLDFTPEAMDEAFAEMNKNDYFKSDFWDQKPTPGKKASGSTPMLPELNEPMAKPSAPPIVEMEEPEMPASSFFGSLERKVEPASAEPQKVTLKPMRNARIRAIPELEEIDSATDVPPLKF